VVDIVEEGNITSWEQCLGMGIYFEHNCG